MRALIGLRAAGSEDRKAANRDSESVVSLRRSANENKALAPRRWGVWVLPSLFCFFGSNWEPHSCRSPCSIPGLVAGFNRWSRELWETKEEEWSGGWGGWVREQWHGHACLKTSGKGRRAEINAREENTKTEGFLIEHASVPNLTHQDYNQPVFHTFSMTFQTFQWPSKSKLKLT